MPSSRKLYANTAISATLPEQEGQSERVGRALTTAPPARHPWAPGEIGQAWLGSTSTVSVRQYLRVACFETPHPGLCTSAVQVSLDTGVSEWYKARPDPDHVTPITCDHVWLTIMWLTGPRPQDHGFSCRPVTGSAHRRPRRGSSSICWTRGWWLRTKPCAARGVWTAGPGGGGLDRGRWRLASAAGPCR